MAEARGHPRWLDMRDAALARIGLSVAVLVFCDIVTPTGRGWAAEPTSAPPRDSGADRGATARSKPAGKGAAHLPAAHSRDDTGDVVDVDLHAESRIAGPDATALMGERVVQPFQPPPVERAVPTPPDIVVPHLGARPSHPDLGRVRLLRIDGEPQSLRENPREPDVDPAPPSGGHEVVASAPRLGKGVAPSTRIADPIDDPPVPPPVVPVAGAESGSGTGDPATPKLDVLDVIRAEIKQRLPYFQACVKLARRRTDTEVPRLEATWAIRADGSVKELKIEGVSDPELVACITRAGSRPFATQPGTDLVVPTPILFVR